MHGFGRSSKYFIEIMKWLKYLLYPHYPNMLGNLSALCKSCKKFIHVICTFSIPYPHFQGCNYLSHVIWKLSIPYLYYRSFLIPYPHYPNIGKIVFTFPNVFNSYPHSPKLFNISSTLSELCKYFIHVIRPFIKTYPHYPSNLDTPFSLYERWTSSLSGRF